MAGPLFNANAISIESGQERISVRWWNLDHILFGHGCRDLDGAAALRTLAASTDFAFRRFKSGWALRALEGDHGLTPWKAQTLLRS